MRDKTKEIEAMQLLEVERTKAELKELKALREQVAKEEQDENIESGKPIPENPFEAMQLPEIERTKAELKALRAQVVNEQLTEELDKFHTRCAELENLMRLVVSVLNATLSYAEA